MPTTWNRSPEEFHKIYLANTDAFYRIGSNTLAKELDDFMTRCALGLWSRQHQRAPCGDGESDLLPRAGKAQLAAVESDQCRLQ